MSITITLTDPLAEQLRVRARRQHLQVEELVFTLLKNALQPADQDIFTPEWARLKSNFACYIPDETDAERAAELQISLRR